jgi:plastocyanin
MSASRISIAVVAAMLLALAAGCGAGAYKTTTTPADVTMTEYQLSPAQLSVKRGAKITVANDGQIAHNLTIEQGPDPKKPTKKLIGTSTFLPGKTETLTIDLKPGRYAMACTLPDHRQLGMRGTLTVK